MSEKMKIGVVGCGMISGTYLENMINIFDNLEVLGCAAEHFENAEITAKKFGIKAMTLDEILADPDIEMIVNLTSTNAHYEVISKALKAGKHVYTEKALCETLEQAAEVVALAKTHKLELGCAPETIFGEATQTVKRLIDDGAIGTVTGFHASINLNMNLMYPHFRILNLPGGDIGLDRGIYFLNQLCHNSSRLLNRNSLRGSQGSPPFRIIFLSSKSSSLFAFSSLKAYHFLKLSFFFGAGEK